MTNESNKPDNGAPLNERGPRYKPGLFVDETPKGWIPWSWLSWIFAFLFVIGGQLVFIPIGLGIGWITEDGTPSGGSDLLWFLLIPFSITLVITLIWTRYVDRRSFASIGLKSGGALSKFGAGWLLGALMVLLVVGLGTLFGGYELGAFAPALSLPPMLAIIGLMLLAFVVQGSTEEVVFRGWLLSAITYRRGLITAIVINSILFALLHFDPDTIWVGHMNLILFAVFTSVWAWREGGILGVCGWHAGWNWLLGTGFEIPLSGIDTGIPAFVVQLQPTDAVFIGGGSFGPEASLVTTAVLAVSTILVLFWRPSRSN